MATTTDLTTLKINYLSQAQYDNALANNQINSDELYFTPADNGVTLNVNGQSTSSPSFYAPTDSGTAGNFLKSGGSGVAPTWAALTSSEVITALGSQTKNYVLAAPSSANGTPSFRALVADDIPTLSITDKTSGTLTVARGGTGKTSWDINKITYASAANTLGQLGHASSTSYLLKSGSATAAPSWIQYTNANTASTIVQRDSSGNFSAGTITAALSGNATSATKANRTTTTNAVAYYTDTTGTFGSKASANGALYATEANGSLSWGTLPVAQGGTGATTAANARTNLGTLAAISEEGIDYTAMAVPSGTTSSWIRVPSSGLLPHEPGGAGSGHSSLGASGWYFQNAYIDNIYGTLTSATATANRLAWFNENKQLVGANHYVSATKIAINSTAAPTENFYVNGTMCVHRDTTTADDLPAGINFSVKDTTTNQTQSSGGIFAYHDHHASSTYGFNMVIKSGGAMIIGGGEGPSSLYTVLHNNAVTNNNGNLNTEASYFVTDGATYIYSNANSIAERTGIMLSTAGHILPYKAEAANDNVQNLGASNNRWANIYSAYTHSSTFYFGVPSFANSSRAALVYSSAYPYHGIWYFDETNDTMTLDVHGKANSKTEADLAIGALGAGIISTRNRYIPHTNNTTGTVGTQYIPVYVNAGTITQITANSVLTNLSSTTAASTYAASPRPGVTGTLPIANGGTGATTRLAAARNLTEESVPTPTHVVGLTTSWAKFGYTTIAQLKTTIGLNATVNSGTANYLAYYTNATTLGSHANFYFTTTPSLVGNGGGFTLATSGTQTGRLYTATQGTTETTGTVYLIVGNNIAAGTAENAQGIIQIHGTNTGRHRIQAAPNANTSNYVHYLPHRTGWIASGGTATAGSEAGVGSASQPVYLSSAGVLTACSAIPQMEIISITGNGSNQVTLTFSFAPDVIFALSSYFNPTAFSVNCGCSGSSVCWMSKVPEVSSISNLTTSTGTAVHSNLGNGLGLVVGEVGTYGTPLVIAGKSTNGKSLFLKWNGSSPAPTNGAMYIYNASSSVYGFLGIKVS